MLEFIAPSSTGGLSTQVQSLVRFDLEELWEVLTKGDDGNGSVVSAYLRLFTSDECNFKHNALSHHIGIFSVGLADNNLSGASEEGEWTEMQVTWNNAPSLEEGGGTMVNPLGGLEPNKWFETGQF